MGNTQLLNLLEPNPQLFQSEGENARAVYIFTAIKHTSTVEEVIAVLIGTAYDVLPGIVQAKHIQTDSVPMGSGENIKLTPSRIVVTSLFDTAPQVTFETLVHDDTLLEPAND